MLFLFPMVKYLFFTFRRNIFLLWPDLLSIFEIFVSSCLVWGSFVCFGLFVCLFFYVAFLLPNWLRLKYFV